MQLGIEISFALLKSDDRKFCIFKMFFIDLPSFYLACHYAPDLSYAQQITRHLFYLWTAIDAIFFCLCYVYIQLKILFILISQGFNF